MGSKLKGILFLLFLLASNAAQSASAFNIILLPDLTKSFKCHQPGVEFPIADTQSLAVLGVINCNSDRSTYGDTNDNVTNSFSRLLVPWRYAWNGVFKDGQLIQFLIGVETSEFSSSLGSEAEVTFMDFGLYYGYQWFWQNGFNLSLLGGLAYLVKTSSSKNIAPGETNDVIDFLDKNTKTNVHGGAGIIFGWKF